METKNVIARKIIWVLAVSLVTLLALAMSAYAVQTTFDGTPSTNRNDYLYVSNFSNTNEWLPTASVISNESFLNVSQDDRGSRMISFSIERGMCIDTKATAYPSIEEGNFRNVMLKLSNTLLVDEISGTVNTQFGLQDSVGGNEVFIREDVGGGSDVTNLLFTNWSIGVPQNLTLCRNTTGGGAFLIENNRQDINQIMYTTINSELDHDKLNLTLLSGADGSAIYTHFYIYNLTLGAPQGAVTNPPTIAVINPFNNQMSNDDPIPFNYDVTVDPSQNITNISIFVNGTFQQAVTTDANQTLSIADGLYDFTVTIYQSDGQEASDTVTAYIKETVLPISDHNIIFYTGRELVNSENRTVTFDNSNISMTNFTIFSSGGAILFSEQHNNVFTPTDTITVQVDASAFGVDTLTMFSNVSDVFGNHFSLTTTIDIIGTTPVSLACDYGSGFTTCIDTLEGGTLEQVQLNCLNGTSSLASLNLNTTPVFSNQPMTQLGDLYTYDNPDEVLVVGIYNLSSTCSNPAQTSFIQTSFNGTITPPAPVVDTSGATLAGFNYNALLTLTLFIAIIGTVVTFMRKRTKGGASI